MENTKQNEALDEAVAGSPLGSPDGFLRSRDAFLRDLPDLLAIPKYDRWFAAYHGDERIGISKSQIDLLRECHERGLGQDDFFVGCVFPHGEEDEEIGTGFFEFEDVEGPDAPTPSERS